jgi:hypothetical protein
VLEYLPTSPSGFFLLVLGCDFKDEENSVLCSDAPQYLFNPGRGFSAFTVIRRNIQADVGCNSNATLIAVIRTVNQTK